MMVDGAAGIAADIDIAFHMQIVQGNEAGHEMISPQDFLAQLIICIVGCA